MELDAKQPVIAEAYAALIFDRREALSRTLAGIVRPTDTLVCEIGSGHGHFLTASELTSSGSESLAPCANAIEQS